MSNHNIAIKAIGVTTAAAMFFPMTAGVSFTAKAQSGIEKNESVYVNTDSKGDVESKTVSNWLHSNRANASVNDIANLTGIKNISGNQKPDIRGNSVTWKLSGKDLYYSGNTNKALPISMKISYYLDGKSISPKEIAGKSGKVEIKISFKNLDGHSEIINGKTMQIYTPFLCAAVLNLPKKQFSNVSVNIGNIQDDGVNQMLCFVSIPGLKDNFSMVKDYIKITDVLDVKADVNNFQLGPVMAMAMPAANLNSLKSSDGISDISDKLGQLYNAGVSLKTATGKLSSGEAEFASGIQQLYNGVISANSSYRQVQRGAQKLKDGADDPKGIKLLQSSLSQLSAGAQKLKSGTSKLYNAVNSADIGSALNNLSGLGKVSDLNDGAQQVSKGLSELNSQLSSASTSISQYQKQISELNKGAGSLSDAISQIYGIHDYMPSIDSLGKQAPSLASGTKSYVDTTNTLLLALRSNPKLFADVAGELAQNPSDKSLQTELAFLYNGSSQEKAALQQMKIDSDTIAATQKTFQSGGDQIVSGTKSIGDSFPTLSASLDKIDANMPDLIKGSKSLYAGTQELNKQLNPSKSSNQSDYTLYDKAAALSAGVGKLSDGASKVAAGTDKLNSAISNSKLSGLSKSVSQLKNGVSALNSGSSQLSSGLSKVNSGAGSLTTLQNGIDKIYTGIGLFHTKGLLPLQSGTSKLNSASGRLSSGASELNSGMNEFFNKGISKCKSTEIDDISDALKVKDVAINLADKYNSFSGVGNGIESNVKFILKTDEIKAPSVTAHKAKATPKVNKNFFENIADWFKSIF